MASKQKPIIQVTKVLKDFFSISLAPERVLTHQKNVWENKQMNLHLDTVLSMFTIYILWYSAISQKACCPGRV